MTADEIRALRAQLGLTKTELGALIGKSRDMVRRYEERGVLPPRDVRLRLQELQRTIPFSRRPARMCPTCLCATTQHLPCGCGRLAA